MPQDEMPTMRSRRLGNELRRLRLAAELSCQKAADVLECGKPKISQIENGKRGIRPLDLTTLLNLYGVTDETYRANLKRLAREIHRVDWWSGQAPVLRGELRDYLTLESDSHLVRSYESRLVPGLLQSESYMRAVFAAAGMKPDRADQCTQIRLKRQELLESAREFRLRTVIDAPALHRMGGDQDLIAEQLNHLLNAGERENVHVQVLPLDAAIPMQQCGTFSLCSVRGEPPAEMVWLEQSTSSTLLEQERDVEAYSTMWDELTAAALSPSASQKYIRDLIKERAS